MSRAHVVTMTEAAVNEIHVYEQDFDAHDKLLEMVASKLVDYGYDVRSDDEAGMMDIVENDLHGSWEEDLIDFGDCDGPVFQQFDCPLLPYF